MTRVDPEIGDLYLTTTGRTVEILAVDTVANSWEESVEAVAYRFVGCTMVHLRGQSGIAKWTRIEGG